MAAIIDDRPKSASAPQGWLYRAGGFIRLVVQDGQNGRSPAVLGLAVAGGDQTAGTMSSSINSFNLIEIRTGIGYLGSTGVLGSFRLLPLLFDNMADTKDARRANGAGLRDWILAACGAWALLTLSGCWGGPEGVAPPDWDPEGMAEAAMELYDKNSDGILDQQELAAAPGLKAAAEAEGDPADRDGDGNLTQEEIQDRIEYYEESAVGITNFSMTLLSDRQQPMSGATVEVVPEPFLEGVLDVARGTTAESGFVLPSIEGEPVEGIRPGMYRVVVTSGGGQLPAKYTASDTTPIGIEVTTPGKGYEPPPPTFVLE